MQCQIARAISKSLRAISEIIFQKKDEQLFNVEKMISKFQLEAVKNIKARYLSGGQKKRVCIAMALLTNPKVILMDEPFQGLDIMSTRDLQETIVNLQTEDSTRSCIISDHAARDLLAISDRAIVLANTKIIADGKPSELLNNEKAKLELSWKPKLSLDETIQFTYEWYYSYFEFNFNH